MSCQAHGENGITSRRERGAQWRAVAPGRRALLKQGGAPCLLCVSPIQPIFSEKWYQAIRRKNKIKEPRSIDKTSLWLMREFQRSEGSLTASLSGEMPFSGY